MRLAGARVGITSLLSGAANGYVCRGALLALAQESANVGMIQVALGGTDVAARCPVDTAGEFVIRICCLVALSARTDQRCGIRIQDLGGFRALKSLARAPGNAARGHVC
jgi:hypothetical protein